MVIQKRMQFRQNSRIYIYIYIYIYRERERERNVMSTTFLQQILSGWLVVIVRVKK